MAGMSLLNDTRQPVWKRPKDAIRIFQVSNATLYRWISEKRIRSMKIEGVRFVDCSAFVSDDTETAPTSPELLERAARLETEGRQAHKHAEEIERYVAEREAAEKNGWSQWAEEVAARLQGE